MGQNCCSASRDKSVPIGTSLETSTHRNVRQSPTWSFRWDNRTHIEDIMEGSVLYPQRVSISSSSEAKSAADRESNTLSEVGSKTISLRRKSFRNGGSENAKFGASDECAASNSILPSSSSIKFPISTLAAKSEDHSSSVNGSAAASYPTSLRQSIRSSGLHFHRQISDSHISPLQSPRKGISLEARRHSVGSHGISSSRWSMRTFSELVASSHRALLPLDGGNSKAFESSLKSCSICLKSLKEKSPWSGHNIVSTNDLPVAAVLVCGHAYHAECLEASTSDVDIYDPPCQACMNNRDRLEISQEVVIDSNAEDLNPGRRMKSVKGSVMGASSSMKKSFLLRNFSMGSRSATCSMSNGAIKKWFWPRYLREE